MSSLRAPNDLEPTRWFNGKQSAAELLMLYALEALFSCEKYFDLVVANVTKGNVIGQIDWLQALKWDWDDSGAFGCHAQSYW